MSTLDGLLMAGSIVMNGLAAGSHLNHFGMMTAAFPGHHVGLAVGNLVAGDARAPNITD